MRILFIFLLLLPIAATGQDAGTKFQNWFDFNGTLSTNENWKYHGEAGYRIIFISEKLHRFFIRPSVSVQFEKIFLLHVGLGAFSLFSNKSTIWEIRPFQGFEIRWPVILSIPLNHYFRFEERFLSSNSKNTFIFRCRYRLAAVFDFDRTSEEEYFYLPLQCEWFVSYGKDIDFQLDEFRGVTGLGYVIDKCWKAELNTIFQNISASSGLFSFNNIIFRFRVYREFNIN